MFLGPNTPISNGSQMGFLEATAEYFIQLIIKKTKKDVASFDVWPAAQADLDRHSQAAMKDIAWAGACRSWYKTDDTGEMTAFWPGSVLHYWEVLGSRLFEGFQWKYRGGLITGEDGYLQWNFEIINST